MIPGTCYVHRIDRQYAHHDWYSFRIFAREREPYIGVILHGGSRLCLGSVFGFCIDNPSVLCVNTWRIMLTVSAIEKSDLDRF